MAEGAQCAMADNTVNGYSAYIMPYSKICHMPLYSITCNELVGSRQLVVKS